MQRLHPATPPYKGIARAISLGSLLFFLVVFAGPGIGIGGTGPALLAGAAGAAIGIGWEVAYYRRFEYGLSGDTFDIASGVISRRHRDIPLRRIQNVDIERNVVQRVLGIAELRLETAGGGSSEAVLRYVAYDEAKRLQGELRRRKKAIENGEERAEATDSDADRPEERAESGELLFELDSRELLLLSAMSFDLGLGVLFGLVLPTFAGAISISRIVEIATELSPIALLGVAALGFALLLLVWLVSAARTFARYYGFRLLRVGDELRYERGLVQRYDGSIPIDKVQTLTLRENLLKRVVGYATLDIETAGYSPGQAPSGGSEAAVPLARRDRALRLAEEIEPIGQVEFERPPGRARRRYGARYTIVLGVLTGVLYGVNALWGGVGVWYAPLVLLVVVPPAAHLKWASRGYQITDDHFLTRNGFWRRQIRIVPHYRIQTVVDSRSYFQRRWQLASVTADTAGTLSLGSRNATAVDYDENDVAELRTRLRAKLQRSLKYRKELRRERELAVGREHVGEDVPETDPEPDSTRELSADAPIESTADPLDQGEPTEERGSSSEERDDRSS